MTDAAILSRLQSLELALALLKDEIKNSRDAEAPPRTFGDLCGILKGLSDTPAEEIDAVLYTFDEDAMKDI